VTTYRLMDGASGRPGNGPSSPTAYTGNFLAGVCFTVTGQVMWFNGYYWWVPTGGDTGAQKFALWNRYSNTAQNLISASVVTSGTLTAGAWNYVALATPVPLAPGTVYVAATGWSSVNGFPDTNNQFGSGDPYASGITNGPLTAWCDTTNGGTKPISFGTTYNLPQGLFSTAGTDPSVDMPAGGSNSANFWMDVLVDDTAPSGYSGSYRFWPNMADAFGNANDTANNFTLGMEFSLSSAATINNVWFYSPPGVTQLPTEIGVYDVATSALVASDTSPSWSGAAGSGWISAALTGSLAASTNYKVVVFNGAATPAIWNCSTANYWDSSTTGYGGTGLTAGPLTAPDNASATSPGQDTYNLGATIAYPATNAGPFNYWVDIEVTPSGGESGAFNITVPAPSVSLAGQIGHNSTFAPVLPAPSVSLAGQIGHNSTFNLILPRPVMSLSGHLPPPPPLTGGPPPIPDSDRSPVKKLWLLGW
jgi:hypothetical protein